MFRKLNQLISLGKVTLEAVVSVRDHVRRFHGECQLGHQDVSERFSKLDKELAAMRVQIDMLVMAQLTKQPPVPKLLPLDELLEALCDHTEDDCCQTTPAEIVDNKGYPEEPQDIELDRNPVASYDGDHQSGEPDNECGESDECDNQSPGLAGSY